MGLNTGGRTMLHSSRIGPFLREGARTTPKQINEQTHTRACVREIYMDK